MVERSRVGRDIFENARVIDQHVDRPKLVVHLGDHPLDRFFVGHVGRNDHRAGARRFDEPGGFEGVIPARTKIDRDPCSRLGPISRNRHGRCRAIRP